MEVYTLSIIGVLALCLLSILLAIYSGSSKGRAGALSGPVLPADDDNLLYRIDRVHLNSVEALAPFVVPAVLAMMVGVGPTTLAVLVWVHVAIRLVHMVIYLRGGNAAKGGSVRTILYVSGALVTLILVVVTGWAAIRGGIAARPSCQLRHFAGKDRAQYATFERLSASRQLATTEVQHGDGVSRAVAS